MRNKDGNPPTNRPVSNSPDCGRLDSVEAIEAFAQAYFAADFPNPERRGCPPRPELIEAARVARWPSDDLRAHLMSCSDCFNEFRADRQTAAAARGATLLERMTAVFTGWRTALAGAALLALLAVITVIALRHHSRTPADDTAESVTSVADDSSRTAANRAPDWPATNNMASAPNTNANPPPSQGRRSPAVVYMAKVALDDYPVLRGAAGQNSQNHKVLTLAPRRYELVLFLPEGSEAGRYRVSVADEFGKTKTAASSASADGRGLRVPLDLSRLAQKPYFLCIARRRNAGKEEPPRCYELRLSDAARMTPQ
jgi:hypothetical protein